MTRRLLAVLLGWFVVGCASAVERSGADAGTDSDGGNDPLCSAPPPPTSPAACDTLPELAIAANAVTGVAPVPTYSTELQTDGINDRAPSCATDGVFDGYETVVRFTPPSGGRWRLTAHGDSLRTLSALRECETEAACVPFDQYDGTYVSPTLTLDLLAQRDESYAIVLDGCDRRVCSFTLTAARIGPLECPAAYGDAGRCDPETTRCAIDPCDAERFVCVPAPPDPSASRPLESATVLRDRTEGIALVSARFRDLSTGPYEGPTHVFYEWLAADGSALPPGGMTMNYFDGVAVGGTIGPRMVSVASEAATAERMRLWFGLDPEARDDAIETEVMVWDRGSAGERCEVGSLATQCVYAHRCVAPGTGTTGTCVASERLEIASAEAWYSRTASSIRLRIDGLSPGEAVTAMRIELIDERGASLIELPLVHVGSSKWDLSMATFEVVTQIQRWQAEPALMARTATVRLRAITADRESPPREVRIQRAAELESGASCVDVDVTCGEALSCVMRGGGAVCEPTVPPGPCSLSGHTARWAPPGSGTYTIEGVPRSWGGVTSCGASRTMSPAEALFIAPVSGRYVFESDGLYSFEVMRSCETPACLAGEPLMRIEIDLGAGERIPIQILSDRAVEETGERFSLRVEVP
jgi:hypothetical protein